MYKLYYFTHLNSWARFLPIGACARQLRSTDPMSQSALHSDSNGRTIKQNTAAMQLKKPLILCVSICACTSSDLSRHSNQDPAWKCFAVKATWHQTVCHSYTSQLSEGQEKSQHQLEKDRLAAVKGHCYSA